MSLGKLVSRLQKLAQIPSRVSKRFATFTKNELQRTFLLESDPFGSRWPERVGSYPWPMLNKTGRLFGSLESVPTFGAGVRISIGEGVPYAQFHQPFRPMIPTNGLPPSWKPVLESMIVEEFKK